MSDIDELLEAVLAQPPAAPQSEYLATKPAAPAPEFDVEQFYEPENLAKFMAGTMTAPFEGISETIVHQGYAAVVWHFRKAALMGDIDRTRSLKMWLEWAAPYIRPKPTEDRIVNPGQAAFAPREPREPK